MNGYKKIIKSQQVRFFILRVLRFVPDRLMLKLQYWIKLKRKLDFNNPVRYTEKIQWYKLFYRNPAMMQCVDKYGVREYVEKKGLKHILNEAYQVVDLPEQINYEALPSKFIIKTTNGSGTNIICRDKGALNIPAVSKQLKSFLSMAEASAGREWAYGGSSKKIIVEKLLEDPSNQDGGVSDYKFLCFDGQPRYIVYDQDRFINHKRNFYTTDWEYLPVSSDVPCFGDVVKKPQNLDGMLQIARQLSEDFPAVRVDLYNIDGKIYFGELTFYPWSGYVQFEPDAMDCELGKHFNLATFETAGEKK